MTVSGERNLKIGSLGKNCDTEENVCVWRGEKGGNEKIKVCVSGFQLGPKVCFGPPNCFCQPCGGWAKSSVPLISLRQPLSLSKSFQGGSGEILVGGQYWGLGGRSLSALYHSVSTYTRMSSTKAGT